MLELFPSIPLLMLSREGRNARVWRGSRVWRVARRAGAARSRAGAMKEERRRTRALYRLRKARQSLVDQRPRPPPAAAAADVNVAEQLDPPDYDAPQDNDQSGHDGAPPDVVMDDPSDDPPAPLLDISDFVQMGEAEPSDAAELVGDSDSEFSENRIPPLVCRNDSQDSLPSPLRLRWTARRSNSAFLTAHLLRLQAKHHLSDAVLEAILKTISFTEVAHTGSGIDVPRTKATLFAAHKRNCLSAGLDTEPLMREVVVCPSCFHIFREPPDHCECSCGARIFSAARAGLAASIPLRTYRLAQLGDVAKRLMDTPGFIDNIRFPFHRLGLSTVPGVAACDVYDGAIWKRMCDDGFLKYSTPFNLAVTIYIDWLPKGKWRFASHGVVTLIIQNLPYELRLSPQFRIDIGFIEGPNKPADLTPLFEELADQLRFADETGFFVNGRYMRMRLHSLLGDHPAMQEILSMAGSTAANFPCRLCMQHTLTTVVGKRKPKSYPYSTYKTQCAQPDFFRTRTTVAKQADQHDSLKQFGVNRLSPFLFLLPGDDDSPVPLLAVPVDPMHCFARIGIHFLRLVLGRALAQADQPADDEDDDDDDESCAEDPSNVPDPRNASRAAKVKPILSTDEQNEFERRLTLLQRLLPSSFYEPLPRDTMRTLTKLKASQRLLQLHTYQVPLFHNLVNDPSWRVRERLSVALRDIVEITSAQIIRDGDLERLDKLVVKFLSLLEEHFGQTETTFYMHSLLHLRACLEQFGTGANMNVFRLERHLLDIRLAPSNGRHDNLQPDEANARAALAPDLPGKLGPMPSPAFAHESRFQTHYQMIKGVNDSTMRLNTFLKQYVTVYDDAASQNQRPKKIVETWRSADGIPLCSVRYVPTMFSMELLLEQSTERWPGFAFISFVVGSNLDPSKVLFGLITGILPVSTCGPLLQVEHWRVVTGDEAAVAGAAHLEAKVVRRPCRPKRIVIHADGIKEPFLPFPLRKREDHGEYVWQTIGCDKDPLFFLARPTGKFSRT